MLNMKLIKIATITALAAASAAGQRREALLIEGPRSVTLKAGETAPLHQILQVPDGARISIRLDQDVAGHAGGLTIGPALPSVDTYDGSSTNPLAQSIRAARAGSYEVKTTAASPDGLRRGEHLVRVEVTESGVRVNRLVAFPAAIRAGDSETVRFLLVLDGENLPPSAAVEGVGHNFSLTLSDNGSGGDTTGGDGIYVAETRISTRAMLPGSCLQFRGVAGGERSQPARVCSTLLPTTMSPSNLGDVFEVDGSHVIRDEVAVEFQENVPETLKIVAAASIGGTIVGTIPAIDAAQIRLLIKPRSVDELRAKVRLLRALPIVKEADLHYVSDGQDVPGFDPNDTYWTADVQWDKTRVRAPEAWVVARGKGQMIGVVDTGVRADHPDLNGRVIKGYDYHGHDSEPQDSHGHGTHVAGIAAAKGNNGQGVAGMAWDAQIFAVRTLGADKQGSNSNGAQGIEQSMVKGTRVINASFSSNSSTYYCSMAQKVVQAGLLLVAAAGNQNSSEQAYPAACGGVIAVGNLTQSDTRNGTSNFGSWVDISAPGTTIWSTKQFGNCPSCDDDATNDGYGTLGGTSMASPIVAGTASLMWSRNSNLPRGEIVERLKATVAPLGISNMGWGRVDAFEAVFNGSFESGLDWWTPVGFAATVSSWHSVTPQHRSRMAYIRVSPNDGPHSGILQRFTFPQERSEVRMLARVGLAAGKPASASTPGPRLTVLADEDGVPITVATFSSESLMNLPQLPNGLVWSGWITVEIPIKKGNQGGVRFRLEDSGTGKTSVALIDSVSFK